MGGPFHYHFKCNFVVVESYLTSGIKKSANSCDSSVVLDENVYHGRVWQPVSVHTATVPVGFFLGFRADDGLPHWNTSASSGEIEKLVHPTDSPGSSKRKFF